MEIERLFAEHRECYGSPRIYRLLVNAGWRVSRRRVARLMRSAGIRARAVRGYRAKANVHQFYVRHPNRLWTTSVTKTNRVWVGDITYLRIANSWRYLAIVMDQYSRRILAWTLNRRRTSTVTCAVLRQGGPAPAGPRSHLSQRSRLGVHGRAILRLCGATRFLAKRERAWSGRQCARGVILSFPKSRTHSWRTISDGACPTKTACALYPLLQHRPLPLVPRLPITYCLRTQCRVTHECQLKWCRIPSTFRWRVSRSR